MAWTNPTTFTTAQVVTAANMNTYLRDNLNALYRTFARKTADESVTSSTALQDDNHLTIAIAASEVWEFHYFLPFTADAAGDLKLALSVPTGATGAWGGLGPDVTTSTNLGSLHVSAFGDANTITFGGANADRTVLLDGVLVNSTNAGNLLLRWAQGTSSGTATTIRANAFIQARRIS